MNKTPTNLQVRKEVDIVVLESKVKTYMNDIFRAYAILATKVFSLRNVNSGLRIV